MRSRHDGRRNHMCDCESREETTQPLSGASPPTPRKSSALNPCARCCGIPWFGITTVHDGKLIMQVRCHCRAHYTAHQLPATFEEGEAAARIARESWNAHQESERALLYK